MLVCIILFKLSDVIRLQSVPYQKDYLNTFHSHKKQQITAPDAGASDSLTAPHTYRINV